MTLGVQDISRPRAGTQAQEASEPAKGATVTFQFQTDAAYDDVASMPGVRGVTNEIIVSAP